MSQPNERQWEYLSVRPPREETMKEASDPTERLNELGAEEWDLATMIDYTNGGTKYIIMKRPREVGTEDE